MDNKNMRLMDNKNMRLMDTNGLIRVYGDMGIGY